MGAMHGTLLKASPHFLRVATVRFQHPVDGKERAVLLVGECHTETTDLDYLPSIRTDFGLFDAVLRVLQKRDKRCVDVFLEARPRTCDRRSVPKFFRQFSVDKIDETTFDNMRLWKVSSALDVDRDLQTCELKDVVINEKVRRWTAKLGEVADPSMTRAHRWDVREHRFDYVYDLLRANVALRAQQGEVMREYVASVRRRKAFQQKHKDKPVRREPPKLKPRIQKANVYLPQLFATLVMTMGISQAAQAMAMRGFDIGVHRTLAGLVELETMDRPIDYDRTFDGDMNARWMRDIVSWASLNEIELTQPVLSYEGNDVVRHLAQRTFDAMERSGIENAHRMAIQMSMIPHPSLVETDIALFFDLLALRRKASHEEGLNDMGRVFPPQPKCPYTPDVMVVYGGNFHIENLLAMFDHVPFAHTVKHHHCPLMFTDGKEASEDEADQFHKIAAKMGMFRAVPIVEVLQRLGSSTTESTIRRDIRVGVDQSAFAADPPPLPPPVDGKSLDELESLHFDLREQIGDVASRRAQHAKLKAYDTEDATTGAAPVGHAAESKADDGVEFVD